MFKDAVSDEGFVYYGLSLDFDTKGRGFYFNSGEKKIIWNGNFLKRETNVHCLRQKSSQYICTIV